MNTRMDVTEIMAELKQIKQDHSVQVDTVSVWQMFFTSTRAHRRAALLALAIPSSATMSGSYVSIVNTRFV
jgi:hypothetical protein